MSRDARLRADALPVLSKLPAGWTVLSTSGPGPFVTRATLRRADGSEVEWTSRRHRKRLGLRVLDPGSPSVLRASGRRPSTASWWMGGLFALGSICFALGSMRLYFDHVQPAIVAWTFFVGSLFFTAASSVHYHETRRAPTGIGSETEASLGLRALLGATPGRIDWWAAAVQLVGTVFFNITTFAATRTDITLAQERHLIWVPDVVGSICFLVASWLAYSEVNHAFRPHSDGSTGWWIAAVNMAGSLAFGAAAVAARYLQTTGDIANITLVNAGTFVGALCFLAGAVLLPVESAREITIDGELPSVTAPNVGEDL